MAYKSCIEKLDKKYIDYRFAEIRAKEAINLADECRKTMNKICEVGTDIGFHSKEHSWAVICINGNKEYVKFMPLTGQDAREVMKFLKLFQYSQHTIDSPLAFRDMVKHELMI